MRGYLPLIQKDSITHMHDLTVYVTEGLPFVRDLSLENFCLCFRPALLDTVFFLYRSPSSSLCTVFDSISPNIDEVLSINPSANLFAFGDLTFNVHHKDWLTYSGESQMTLLRWLTLLLGSPDCDSHSPVLLDFFPFFWRYYLFHNGFPPFGEFWSYSCLFPSNFRQTQSRMPRFIG